MSTNILFLCPHNAAKSVLAESFAKQQLRNQNVENIQLSTAGTEPDEANSRIVLDYLTRNEFEAPMHDPRRVSQADLDAADYVISFGCDLSEFELKDENKIEWLGVLDTSQDVKAAATDIEDRVKKLFDKLLD
jgi:protein-tyrosine-phosphatase